MTTTALALGQGYSLTPSSKMNSWSQFTRQFTSATSIMGFIPKGKFLEIADKKFLGETLIVFRRGDFDNLTMRSSMATRITRCLMQIDKMTTTYQNASRPEQVIELIHEQARMGIEFTITPSTSSASDYFRTFTSSEDNDEDLILPKSRKDILR